MHRSFTLLACVAVLAVGNQGSAFAHRNPVDFAEGYLGIPTIDLEDALGFDPEAKYFPNLLCAEFVSSVMRMVGLLPETARELTNPPILERALVASGWQAVDVHFAPRGAVLIYDNPAVLPRGHTELLVGPDAGGAGVWIIGSNNLDGDPLNYQIVTSELRTYSILDSYHVRAYVPPRPLP